MGERGPGGGWCDLVVMVRVVIIMVVWLWVVEKRVDYNCWVGNGCDSGCLVVMVRVMMMEVRGYM